MSHSRSFDLNIGYNVEEDDDDYIGGGSQEYGEDDGYVNLEDETDVDEPNFADDDGLHDYQNEVDPTIILDDVEDVEVDPTIILDDEEDVEGDPAMNLDDGDETNIVHKAGGNDVAVTAVEGEEIIPPRISMRFPTSMDVFDYVHQYGRANGFQISVHSSEKKKKGEDDVVEYKRLRLCCSKSGKFRCKAKNPAKGPTTSKTGCPFKVNANLQGDGSWSIGNVMLDHNHECQPNNSRFLPNYRVISESNKKRILDNDRAGVPIAKNIASFVVQHGSHADLPFDRRDCRNLIAKSRRFHMESCDFAAMRKHFEMMVGSNSNFFYAFDVDEDNRLTNVFWADGRSIAAYKEFGDVVSFDTTYISNRYNMPFAPFIGVNNHGQSILFGCALITREHTEDFVWLFRTWQRCMSEKAPRAIITYQCQAIGNAVKQVFPETPHRWCIWHVMQNASKNMGSREQWDNIHRSLQSALHDSLSVSEFEESWKAMVDRYGLQRDKWIVNMFANRRRWVPIFFKDCFWAGMSSTQRSEGMNHFFKRYLNKNTTLTLFVQQYGLAFSDRVNAEEKASWESLHSPRLCMTTHVFEEVFRNLYTTGKFSEFQKEVTDMTYNNAAKVQDDGRMCVYNIVVKKKFGGRPGSKTFRVTVDKDTKDMKCECRNFEFRGIVCTHILCVFREEMLDYVPATYILDRWRKDLPREHLKVSVPYYDLLKRKPEGMRRYESMIGSLDSFAGYAIYDKELYDEVMATLEGMRTKVTAAARQKHGVMLQNLDNIRKVYGRKWVSSTDDNQGGDGDEADPTPPVKDPVDKRGRGRAQVKIKIGFTSKNKTKENQKKPKQGLATNYGVGTSAKAENCSQSQGRTSHMHGNGMPRPDLMYQQMYPPYAYHANPMGYHSPLESSQLSQTYPPTQSYQR